MFRPMLELDRLEGYATVLERIARHAGDGTFGRFVETDSDAGDVRITLYERWFDGDGIHCEELAKILARAGS